MKFFKQSISHSLKYNLHLDGLGDIAMLFVLDNPELGYSPKKCLKRLFLFIPL